MEVKKDFREFFELLNSHGVDYVVVGAFALAHYGAPRYTGDMDIFIRPEPDNAVNVMNAVKEFGIVPDGVTEEIFCVPNKVIQLGYSPNRIDILTAISGVTWLEVQQNCESAEYGSIPVRYIGKSEFIANKLASGRLKDLADIESITKK